MLGVVEGNRTTALWKRGKLIWEEDDARPPDRETLKEAWRRLVGGEVPRGERCLVYDAGDCMYLLASNGYTFCYSYDGSAIWEPLK